MATMIGPREEWFAGAALGAAGWVCLAAAPTFAVMALWTVVLAGGSRDMMCAPGHAMSLLSGMAWMYMLMAAFHSAPWLKLIANRRGVLRQS